MINSTSCYTVNSIEKLAKDNNYYCINIYKTCKVNDYLTGTMTRGNFEDTMNIYLDKYSNFIIVIGDIDNFKLINDTYGHKVGDKVLKFIGSILNDSIRDTDIVGRYGGEEFIICLLENDLDNAYKTVERIRNKIEDTMIDIGNDKISITMTFGISNYNINKTYEETVEEADKALYIGKTNGRNQTKIYKEKQKIKVL